MRRIMIKAWNTGKKKFEEDYFIRCSGCNTETPYLKLAEGELSQCEPDNKNIIFLLNTGIKDNNGVEGFHKDIVRDFRGGMYTIEWDESFAVFILKEQKGENYLPIYFLQYSEILGCALET